MKIWKYQIQIDGLTELEAPKGAHFVIAAIWQGDACVWAVVDPDKPKTKRKILSVWTGHETGEFIEYIGMFNVGSLIYHVIEVE